METELNKILRSFSALSPKQKLKVLNERESLDEKLTVFKSLFNLVEFNSEQNKVYSAI